MSKFNIVTDRSKLKKTKTMTEIDPESLMGDVLAEKAKKSF